MRLKSIECIKRRKGKVRKLVLLVLIDKREEKTITNHSIVCVSVL